MQLLIAVTFESYNFKAIIMIKKILFCASILTVGFVSAQSFQLMDHHDVDISNGTHYEYGSAITLGATKFHFENLTGSQLAFAVKVERIYVPSTLSDLAVCFGTECYSASGGVAGTQVINNGVGYAVAANELYTDLKIAPITWPWATPASDSAVWSVTIFNEVNPSDSISTLIIWKSQVCGDVSGNGLIEGSELAGDQNENGFIDGSEIAGDITCDGQIGAGEVSGDLDASSYIEPGEFSGDVNGDGVIGAGEVWFDIDGDGVLGDGEIAGDLNGDYVISNGEIAGDTDGDGLINGGELEGDVNGNGIIDNGEIHGDTNGDGVINGGEVAVSVHAITKESVSLTAYPNPAISVLTIEYVIDGEFVKANIDVFDVLGQKVAFKELNSKRGAVVLSLKQLNSGVYFYSIQVDGLTIRTESVILK